MKILVLVALAAGCHSKAPTGAATPVDVTARSGVDGAATRADAPTMLSYTYSDGSGNRFVCDGASRTVAYDPVTPQQSSSGMYSGGAPWQATLDVAAYEALGREFEAALQATAEHVTERAKGTGLVNRADGQAAILAMSSTQRGKLEQALRSHKPEATP